MELGVKKAGEAILMSDRIDFRTKATAGVKEGRVTMTKGSMQQKRVTLVNIYMVNVGATNRRKQILRDIKGDADSNSRGLGHAI